MSQVFVTELPEMLFDAQRADACRHRYHQNEDVFALEKWRSLVESACQSGDLATEQGMVDIERVNDWLGWPKVRLWSVFRLHNPLLPEMEWLYDKALAEIGQGLKARIAEADPRLERDWDNLPPAGRYKRVIVCDSLNGPKSRLFDALSNICFWNGDASGKSIHDALVAEIESWKTLVADRPSEKELRDTKLAQLEQSMRRCDAVRERLLAGVIPWSDEIGEIIDLLRQFAGEPWCYQIRFPVWLENVERIPKTSEESISGTPESDVPTAPIPLNGRCAMNRKVIFWLAPNETLIPADQVPGAIADTLYPPPERRELAGQAPNDPNDPNAVKRLEAEREQANQLRIKFPHLKDGDKFSIGDLNDYLARHEMVAEIRQRREAVDHLDPEGRWARRQFEDGFNAVREPVVEARRSHLELSDKQCTELAGQRELFIDHWIELVGVGIGQHESYDIARDGVVFRKWEDKFISESPNEWQIDMERDNRIAPHLAFPCTPAELVEFVDNAIGIHCFGVPDAFRAVVEQSVPSKDGLPTNPNNAYQADWPLCTKQELIDGFQLTGKNWADFLSRPNRDAIKYKDALKQPGKPGIGGDALWSLIIFAGLLVKNEDLTAGQVKARFVKVENWKQWEAEMASEIGAI